MLPYRPANGYLQRSNVNESAHLRLPRIRHTPGWSNLRTEEVCTNELAAAPTAPIREIASDYTLVLNLLRGNSDGLDTTPEGVCVSLLTAYNTSLLIFQRLLFLVVPKLNFFLAAS